MPLWFKQIFQLQMQNFHFFDRRWIDTQSEDINAMNWFFFFFTNSYLYEMKRNLNANQSQNDIEFRDESSSLACACIRQTSKILR